MSDRAGSVSQTSVPGSDFPKTQIPTRSLPLHLCRAAACALKSENRVRTTWQIGRYPYVCNPRERESKSVGLSNNANRSLKLESIKGQKVRYVYMYESEGSEIVERIGLAQHNLLRQRVAVTWGRKNLLCFSELIRLISFQKSADFLINSEKQSGLCFGISPLRYLELLFNPPAPKLFFFFSERRSEYWRCSGPNKGKAQNVPWLLKI